MVYFEVLYLLPFFLLTFFSFSLSSPEFSLSWFVPILFPFSHFLIFSFFSHFSFPSFFSFLFLLIHSFCHFLIFPFFSHFSFPSFSPFFSSLSLLFYSLHGLVKVGETSPHFPPHAPHVITSIFLDFFFFIFFSFFILHLAQCEPCIQKYHMAHVMCLSLKVSCSIHMIMSCHPTPGASKNVKFRLSQNPIKFYGITRFHKTNTTVESVSSSEIYKIFGFQSKLLFYPY